MLNIYTKEDIINFGFDEDGYKVCPSGDYSAIDDFDGACVFGKKSVFGDNARFGNECEFGDDCTFGKNCHFGSDCEFRNACTFNDQCSFKSYCYFGLGCDFGKCCYFGDYNSFGSFNRFDEKCSFGQNPHFDIGCRFKEKCKCLWGEIKWVYVMSGSGPDIYLDGERIQFYGLANGDVIVESMRFIGSIQSYKKMLKKGMKEDKLVKNLLAQVKMIEKVVDIYA